MLPRWSPQWISLLVRVGSMSPNASSGGNGVEHMLRNSSFNSGQEPMMQTLEQRRMLSVAVVDGTLCVRGTDHGDRIAVSVDHGQVTVTMNGNTRHFGLNDVTKLKIQA